MGGENQEDEEMKILNTSNKYNKQNTNTTYIFFFLGQLGLINRGRSSYNWGGRAFVRGTLCELEHVKILIEFSSGKMKDFC